MPPKVPILYPKRKERGLIFAIGDSGADSVINQITETTINQVASTNLDEIADGTSYKRVAAAELAAGIYKSASTTDDGIIEIAIASEVNTGTSATLAVSPDALAGSNLGTKAIEAYVFEAGTDVSTGDGKVYFLIPAMMDGMNLIRAQAAVILAGATNDTRINIHNVTDSQEMLSLYISVASGQTVGTVGTINTSYDDVATNDVLSIDVDAVSTTAPKGLLTLLEFGLP